jgi:uncharacterized protein YqjF (DUF2071 family)
VGIDLRTHPGRLYPPPTRPWSVRMVWHDLLFMHWRVELNRLRPFVPPALEIETFDGSAWLGVIPFAMSGVRHRVLPAIPGAAAFPELNVRTYVRAPGPGGAPRPGVWFFSLDAANVPAVVAARALFHLAYMNASMRLRRVAGAVHYESRRTGPFSTLTCGQTRTRQARFRARYRPVGGPVPAPHGSAEHFLTDRYCLYAAARSGRLYRAEIHHQPWPLRAAEAAAEVNTMAEPIGIDLGRLEAASGPPRLHYAPRMEVVAWSPEPVAACLGTDEELSMPSLAAS